MKDNITSVGIMGLGLIGGSMAKGLKEYTDLEVIGYNRNPKTLKKALESRVIDKIYVPGEKLEADVVVLAFPPRVAVEFLKDNAKFFAKGTVVTDVCGVKEGLTEECTEICSQAGLFFVGGHPMAGKEVGGFDNSQGDLFWDASYILTPIDKTDPKALEKVKRVALMLKVGRLTVTTPKKHDRIIAYTSQLPHVLAGAYINSPAGVDRVGFSAGSYLDITRVATADETLWQELFLANSKNLVREIDTLIQNLSEYKQKIAIGDKKGLEALIVRGHRLKKEDKERETQSKTKKDK